MNKKDLKNVIFDVEKAKMAWPSAEHKQEGGEDKFTLIGEFKVIVVIGYYYDHGFRVPHLTVDALSISTGASLVRVEMDSVTEISYGENFAVEFISISNTVWIRGPLRRLRINDTGYIRFSTG